MVLTQAPVWTQTTSFSDLAAVLDATRVGTPWSEWRTAMHAALPQAGLLRRKDILEFCRRHALEGRASVAPTRFLDLFQAGTPHRRRTLVLGRVAWGIPLVRQAVDFLEPWRRRLGEPLLPEDSLVIPPSAWSEWIRSVTAKDPTTETVRRSLGNTISHLGACGSLALQGIRPRTTRIQRAEPDPLAIAWLLANELRQTARSEASELELVRNSFAARLFCMSELAVAAALEEGVHAGLLSRSYLLGIPRYHPQPELVA